MQILAEVFVKGHELPDAKGGEQERNGETRGIDGEEKDATADFVAGSGNGENGCENGTDTGSPPKGKRETEQKAAPDAGLFDVAAKMNIAIKPASKRRSQKPDERQREEVDRCEASEKRSVTQKRENPDQYKDDTEDDAVAKTQFNENAQKVKAKDDDEGPGDGREKRAILQEEVADSTGGSAEGDENDGEASDESECGRKEPGARNFAFAELLHADAGEHGDVAGHERQNAR
jgi:hypothetical protein